MVCCARIVHPRSIYQYETPTQAKVLLGRKEVELKSRAFEDWRDLYDRLVEAVLHEDAQLLSASWEEEEAADLAADKE